MEQRECRKCHETKPIADFGHHKPGYPEWRCKTCKAAHAREYRKKNADRKKEVDRLHYQNNKERHRETYMIRTYGIDPDQYEQMVRAQEGKCLICDKVPRGTGRTSKLYIDHDHVTGEIRGLLCSRCNSAIGLLDDTPEHLERAIRYLTRDRVNS